MICRAARIESANWTGHATGTDMKPPHCTEAEGLRLTRQVSPDMHTFHGYASHQLLIDQATPAHLIALGHSRRPIPILHRFGIA